MTHRLIAEWPTLALLILCYAAWAVSLFWLSELWLPLAIFVAALSVTLHASLTHEMVHGHPTDDDRLNHALVWPVLGLFVPYGRFRDTHLAHHRDARLTDPYDDPESNYLDPVVWRRLPAPVRTLLRANNTLLGRMTLGPAIGQVAFMWTDWKASRSGDRRIAGAWIAHIPSIAVVVSIVWFSPLPLWAYAIAVYAAHGVLRIRTFLEHRAHEHTAARTVIIEDRGPLALLFLNNNYHLVHHMHPRVPWFRLPALYLADAERYLRRNQGYWFRSYGEIFARHFLAAKDPVPHPLWTGGERVERPAPQRAPVAPAYATITARSQRAGAPHPPS
ncbi:MAG: fatty acid desaturase [Pseudomonadota bacterium]